MKKFQISKKDWELLMEANQEARRTMISFFFTTSNGRFVTPNPAKRILKVWEEIGKKYGFYAFTVRRFNKKQRIVWALPRKRR